MADSVDTLRVTVHSPAGREAAAARLAEQFTRDVLEQLSQIVEARSPGRVVLIRRMAVRWSLSEADLSDPANATSCAAGLADSIEAGKTGASHATDTIVTFDDEAEWLAAYLRARAAGAAGEWFHAAWREAEHPKPGRASPLRRQTVLAALSRLRATGELAGVLAALPAATTNALSVVLGIDGVLASGTDETAAAQHGFTTPIRPAYTAPGHELSSARVDTDGQADLNDRRGAEPDDDPADASPLASRTGSEGSYRRDVPATNEPVAAAAVTRLAGTTPSPNSSPDATSTHAMPGSTASALTVAPVDVATDETPPAAMAGASPDMAPGPLSSDDAASAEAALIAAVAAATQQTGTGASQPVAPAPPGLPVPHGRTGPATRFGGLFYLLALALELGIGESLWKVCLPEGLIFAHAAAVLLGPDAAGDPAPAAFGGITIGELPACPAVSPEQHADASIELLGATAAALPRYDMAPAPEVFLDLAASPAGRMLVASGLGPFALFAWQAHDARATAAGVAAFLRVWPAAFPPPRAREVLLGLDTSGRLRSAPGPIVRAAPLLPAAPTAPAAALLAQVCGAMAELFALRAAVDPGVATEMVSRYLAIPGNVALEPDAMTIVLPMDGIDLAVRRAALDRDAGWVPWLGRAVRIEFVPQGGGDVV